MGNFARKTGRLEVGPGNACVAAPYCTHQPPLPRRPGFQSAPAHDPAQQNTSAQATGWRHAGPIHPWAPPPDVSQPRPIAVATCPGRAPTSNSGRGASRGRHASEGRKWLGGSGVRVTLRISRCGVTVSYGLWHLLDLWTGRRKPCSGPRYDPASLRKPGESLSESFPAVVSASPANKVC